MSTTAAAWLVAVAILALLSLRKPIWALSLYLLTFFAFPPYHWWGKDLPSLRWNLYAACVLLVSVLIHWRPPARVEAPAAKLSLACSLLILANATAVHFLLAPSRAISEEAFIVLMKLTLLYFLMLLAVRTPADFRTLLWSLALGVGYLGFEITFQDRGRMVGGRLEGIGVAGAATANALACLVVTVLPPMSSLFFTRGKLTKVAVAVLAPLGINVLFLCNSRGAFLGLFFAAVALLASTHGKGRRMALIALALGSVAGLLLLGDPRVIERFATTFASSDERDSSAQSRLTFWRAGLHMVAERPLGSGGDGFKRALGWKYLSAEGVHIQVRSVHNGYLDEACQWGVQGLVLRIAFILGALWYGQRAARHRGRLGDTAVSIQGSCLVAGGAGFLVSSLFGTYLDDEVGYWLAAALLVYGRLYGPEASLRDGTVAGQVASDASDASDVAAPTVSAPG